MAKPGTTIPYGKIKSAADLGALVRRRRRESDGARQEDTAALAGVGNRFLSELERGKETAELGKVLQVLDRVGLEVWVVPRGAAPTREATPTRGAAPASEATSTRGAAPASEATSTRGAALTTRAPEPSDG